MQRRNLMPTVAWLLLTVSPVAAQTDYVWQTDGSGSWTDPVNWAPAGFPDAPGDSAQFDLPLTGPITVQVNTPITVGRICLQDWNWDSPRVTLAPGPDEGTLTFDGNGGETSVTGFGRHEISTPVHLDDTLWIENADERRLELELALSGGVAGGPGHDLVLDGMWLNVELTAPDNPVQGAVIVYPTDPYGDTAGLNLTHEATMLAASRFEAHLGTVIGLDNAVAYVNDRVASPVYLYGGGLGLHGNATAITTEAIPVVGLFAGSSSLGVTNFPGGRPATLDIGTLIRAAGTTVEFWGWELATTTFIRINEPAGPPLDWGGLIGGWAIVGDWLDQDFATYSPVLGVAPVPAYVKSINGANQTENVLVEASDTLWFSKTINSLKIAGEPTLNLMQNSLDITSGGLLSAMASGLPGGGGSGGQGQTGLPALITNGQLTAGGLAPPQNPELIVHVRHDIQIAADIVDHGAVPVALTVSGYSLPWWAFEPASDPVLTLSGLNTYTGPTTICSARVAADSDARFGHPSSSLTLVGGIVQATSTFTTNRSITIYDGAAFEVRAGQTLTLAGELRGVGSELHVRALDGGGAPQATLVLAGPNTFTADVVVGAGGGGPTPVLQVSSDANLGGPDQDIILDGGVFRTAGSFAAHTERVFVIDWGGGAFDVGAGHVFSLDAPGQIAGGGVGAKVGLGKMVISAPNPRYWGLDMEVAEGVLELSDAAALNGQHITLAGGVLNLRHDSDAEFPDDVTVQGGGIDVDGSAAADPVLSIASLELDEGATFTVTGGPGYSLAVEGDADVLGLLGTIRTQTADLTLNGTLRMNEPTAILVKEGPATLTVSGPQEAAPLASLRAIDGTTHIDTDGGGQGNPPDRNLTVEVHGAGTMVHFRHPQHLDGLRLASGGTAAMAAGATNTLVTNALAIDPDPLGAPAGTLDLADNNLVVDYTGGANPFAEIAAWVTSGYRDGPTGYWDGPGITSSEAAAHPRDLTALGVIDNSDPDIKIGGLADLEGEPVSAESVLVKYTWWGDANLDGVVDSNDYDMIDNAWLLWTSQGTVPNGGFRWAVGDFDYDGTINSNDYDKIDNAFLLQSGALGSEAPIPTPEPATLALLAIGALAAARRRR